MSWFDRFFGKKEAKEKIKKNHPNLHVCDFGQKEFNKTKRSRLFIEEIKVSEKKRRPKPTDPTAPVPPPPPPPPGVLERAVILLVFSGDVVAGTDWNVFGELKLEHSGLTLDEQDIVHKAVADFYHSNFNTESERITITTDINVYNASAYSRKYKLIITESWEWFGQSGGVSFVGSFGHAINNIGFVFSSLHGYVLKNIGGAAMHEIGHGLGCLHQSVWDANCVKIQEYNKGGNGEAPVMGIPYYETVPKLIKGTSSKSCYDIQDDYAVMKQRIG